jgi:uncharacterized protein
VSVFSARRRALALHSSEHILLTFTLVYRAHQGPVNMSVKGSSNDLISKLGLHPHVEGGFFRETYRSGATPMASQGTTDKAGTTVTREDGQKRNELTSIIYMLTHDQPMQWMCLNRSPHVHYWQGGGSLTYTVITPDGEVQSAVLGPNADQGEVIQLGVNGGSYKAVRLVDGAEYGMIGEAVGPGFDFRDFSFVTEAQVVERLEMKGDISPELLQQLKQALHAGKLVDEHIDNMYVETGASERCHCLTLKHIIR